MVFFQAMSSIKITNAKKKTANKIMSPNLGLFRDILAIFSKKISYKYLKEILKVPKRKECVQQTKL